MTDEDTQPEDGPNERERTSRLQSTSLDAKVIGELSGTDGTGILGQNRTTSGDSASLPSGLSTGVYGTTDKSGTTNGEPNSVGVFGNSVATSGETVGVVGRTESPDGIGVVGNDISGSGLAMFASGDAVVDGLLTGTEIDASSTDLPLRGHATESGDSTTLPPGLSIGLYGATNKSGTTDNGEPNAVGVFGNSVATSGESIGVVGRTESPDGVGVVGNDISGDGIAVYASGDVQVDGSVSTRDVGVSAYLSSDQTIPNDSQTVVTFDSVVQDDFGAYDPSTGAFTVPADGDYRVEVGLFWNQSFNGDRIDHQIEVNGSIDGGVNLSFDGSGNVARTHTRTLFGLSNGDEITIEVQQRSGSSNDLFGSQFGAETYLSVVKAG